MILPERSWPQPNRRSSRSERKTTNPCPRRSTAGPSPSTTFTDMVSSIWLAERMRFELTMELSPHYGLANRRLKPLGHLSKLFALADIGVIFIGRGLLAGRPQLSRTEGPAMPETTAPEIGLETYFQAAINHANDSGEPDHEIGDLQDMLRAAFATLTDQQKALFFASDAAKNTIEAGYGDTSPNGLDEIETYIDAACNHGADDDPDHEAGDLQDMLRALFETMDVEQKSAFAGADEVRSVMEMGDEGKPRAPISVR